MPEISETLAKAISAQRVQELPHHVRLAFGWRTIDHSATSPTVTSRPCLHLFSSLGISVTPGNHSKFFTKSINRLSFAILFSYFGIGSNKRVKICQKVFRKAFYPVTIMLCSFFFRRLYLPASLLFSRNHISFNMKLSLSTFYVQNLALFSGKEATHLCCY